MRSLLPFFALVGIASAENTKYINAICDPLVSIDVGVSYGADSVETCNDQCDAFSSCNSVAAVYDTDESVTGSTFMCLFYKTCVAIPFEGSTKSATFGDTTTGNFFLIESLT